MYKNWDNVRDYRVYGYLNQKEHDLLEQVIDITGKQKAVCVREMIVAQSEIIINKHNQKPIKNQAVEYRFPDRYFAV
ncbi:hypothetical protein [Faucicola boevrei]|uniref:hypothetical protein n=1 Tax=Faucicola boevrei TaxID=346665 RepID=UPI0003622B95|nr:hypothetical protein [Moraxella boevrei]